MDVCRYACMCVCVCMCVCTLACATDHRSELLLRLNGFDSKALRREIGQEHRHEVKDTRDMETNADGLRAPSPASQQNAKPLRNFREEINIYITTSILAGVVRIVFVGSDFWLLRGLEKPHQAIASCCLYLQTICQSPHTWRLTNGQRKSLWALF